MEKKVFKKDLLNGAILLSDLSGGSYTQTYLTKDGKILKVFPKAEEQNEGFKHSIEMLMSMYNGKENKPPVLFGKTNFSDYILASKDIMEKKPVRSGRRTRSIQPVTSPRGVLRISARILAHANMRGRSLIHCPWTGRYISGRKNMYP